MNEEQNTEKVLLARNFAKEYLDVKSLGEELKEKRLKEAANDAVAEIEAILFEYLDDLKRRMVENGDPFEFECPVTVKIPNDLMDEVPPLMGVNAFMTRVVNRVANGEIHIRRDEVTVVNGDHVHFVLVDRREIY